MPSEKDWRELEASIEAFKQSLDNKNRRDNMDMKQLKAALFEVEMKLQRKDIPYLEYNDILEIMKERRETPNSVINLSQEAFEFYKNDFRKVEEYFNTLDNEAKIKEANDYRFRIEQDKAKAVEIALEQDKKLPYSMRRSKEVITTEINKIVGNPIGGDMGYREKLATYLGGELNPHNNNEVIIKD